MTGARRVVMGEVVAGSWGVLGPGEEAGFKCLSGSSGAKKESDGSRGRVAGFPSPVPRCKRKPKAGRAESMTWLGAHSRSVLQTATVTFFSLLFFLIF